MNAIEKFKQVQKFNHGGKSHYFVKDDQLYRKNSDGTETLFPFIKGSTYNKYSTSKEFMKTLELAFNRYAQRVKNEANQTITLSGKTKPITVKGQGTYNMPIEIFDHIINSAKIANIDPKQGLAIAIKESSGYTDPKRMNSKYNGSLPNNKWIKANLENQAGPSTVVSNWQYFKNIPYIGLLKGWENSGWDVDRMSADARYQYKKHQSDYDEWDKNINEDIFVNMFKLPLNAINPGEDGYDATIKKYARNMSYKFGGKFK